MLKKVTNIFISTFLLFLFILPAYTAFGATATTTKSKTVATPAVAHPAPDPQVSDVKTIIGKNTPSWIADPIIWTVGELEYFRLNYFNNVFIFYGLSIVLVFFIVRSIWRFFF